MEESDSDQKPQPSATAETVQMTESTPLKPNSTLKDVEEGSSSQPTKTKEPTRKYGEMWKLWPKSTICIVANEFCERFSYYGMRAVLSLYISTMLGYDDNVSKMLYNGFLMLCYFSPVFGAFIADGFIGKFKTIFIVSILYAIGQVMLAGASTMDTDSPMHPWLDFIALLTIALGTGGIKPCVSPFGGDQFEPHEVVMLSLFFSVFYFAINAGSLISTFLTPIFRAMPCMGQQSCYPMAFGLPAILMVVAIIIFLTGSFWYKKKKPTTNIFADVCVIIKTAISNKSDAAERRDHWLDYALEGHRCEESAKCIELKAKTQNPNDCAQAVLVEDVKSLCRVAVMMLPVPLFWTLFEQQGGAWTFQARQMNCRLWGDVLFLPDQMQIMNAALILVLIPLFQVAVYPVWKRFFKITPLRKMVVGGLLAAAALIISGFVQFEVDRTLPKTPLDGKVFVTVVNTLPCILSVAAAGRNLTAFDRKSIDIGDNNHLPFEVTPNEPVLYKIEYNAACGHSMPKEFNGTAKSTFNYLHITANGIFLRDIDPQKPKEANGAHVLSFAVALDVEYTKHLALCRQGTARFCDPTNKADFYFFDFAKAQMVSYDSGSSQLKATIYKREEVRPGAWKLYYAREPPFENRMIGLEYTGYAFERREEGGVYMITLSGNLTNPEITSLQVTDDNVLSILWQIPQYFVLTAAEVLFSVTGLEFSYSEASPSMKSIVGSLWLLTNSVGNAVNVIVPSVQDTFTNQMGMVYFFFAALMIADMGGFALLSHFYYVYRSDRADIPANETKANEVTKSEAEKPEKQE